jgi:alpha-beta hydrolase superfamily lysophospholipase
MVRTANRLRMAGVHVVALDLTALGGQNITRQQWYFGLLDTLGQELSAWPMSWRCSGKTMNTSGQLHRS